MNKKQRNILLASACIAALLLLFPPFVSHGQHGAQRNAGIGFIFTGIHGDEYAVVNILQLLIEFIGVSISACCLWFWTKE